MRILLPILAAVLLIPAASCQHRPQTAPPPSDSTAEVPERPGQGQMGQGRMGEGRMGQGRMGQGRMGEGQMGPGARGGDGHHDTIHALLADHEAIERRVEDVPGGVETWTTSDNAEVADLIRVHVRQMDARLESGRPVRRWDPLFAAIFEHADAINMEIEDVPGGVRVVETSDDPEVVVLIRQHARRAVSEFVEGGMERARQPTPMPSED